MADTSPARASEMRGTQEAGGNRPPITSGVGADVEHGAGTVLQSQATGSLGPSLGENLIFLISQPRAGSTLLQKILGGHPKILTLSEPWIALHPAFALRPTGLTTDFDAGLARVAVQEFLCRLPEGEETYWQAVREMLNGLYSKALSGSGKDIFLDKTPRYYFIIPELRRIFPRAHFIFLLRNPLAVFSSILNTWIKTENVQSLRHSRHDLVTAPRLLVEGIRSVGQDGIVIRYEDLASNPEGVMRQLCGSLGIPFHPDMIDYGARPQGDRWRYGDQGTVYREKRPIAEHAVQWISDLKRSTKWTAWARSYLEGLGPDLIQQLGYDYAQLSKEFPGPPEPADWHEASETDDDLMARLRAELDRATVTLKAQKERAGSLESTAAERLAGIQDRDREIAIREERICVLEATAAERLAGMQDRDREIAAREERICVLEATAAERLAGMQDRDREIAAREECIAALQAAAAERLTGMQDRDREIAAREERICVLEATAAERLAGMQDRDREIAAREERIGFLEATAAERLAEMQKLDLALQVHRERIAELEAAFPEDHAAGQKVDDTIHAGEKRLEALQAAATDSLAALQEGSRTISRLMADLEIRGAEIERLRGQITELEQTAASQSTAMREKEGVISELAAALHVLENSAREQQRRAAILETAAAERLEEMEEKDRCISVLATEVERLNRRRRFRIPGFRH